jgi:predicted nucleotidyltransferase
MPIDMPHFGLNIKVIEQIHTVFKKYPEIQSAIIYGSRAKGLFRKGSDIDLVLKGEKLNLEILLKVENEIDELLLPYKIDLSLFQHIDNDDFLEHVNRVGKIFY